MAKSSSARPNVFYVLLGFILLGALGYAVFLAFRGIFGLEPEVQAALFTFLGAFTVWLARAIYESRREERRRGYEHRREVYLGLLSTFRDMFRTAKPHEPSEEMVGRLKEASDLLYLEASDSVFRAFRRTIQHAQEGAAADEAGASAEVRTAHGLRTIHSLACFMLAMRKDVGFQRTALSEHDYLRQLLTDYDDHKGVFEKLQC